MDAIQELKQYIESNEQSGAFLFTGKWGCGKTHLINHLPEQLGKDKYVVAIISVFGIDSIDKLTSAIKQKVFYSRVNLTQETADKVKRVKNFVDKSIDILKDRYNGPKMVGTVLSINPFDFIQIEREIGKDRQLVLVFDDFERSELNIKELLGAINEYVETKRIKTILIADEEKLDKSEYKEFKEKVISRTFRFKPNYPDVISSIIADYRETVPGYKSFLREKTDLVLAVFDESKSENLRSLRALLIDFERVFGFVESKGFEKTILNDVFASFGKILFKEKDGTVVLEESREHGPTSFNVTLAMQEHIEEAAIGPIKDWIRNGIWDELQIESYFENRYRQIDPPDEWKLLNWATWELNETIFKQAFPEVLQKAYNGNLSCGQLIRFIQRISAFKGLGIIEEYDIDYVKMGNGLTQRLKKISEGVIQEPRLNTFITPEEIATLEPEARKLYQRVYRTGEKIVEMLLQRRSFIECVQNGCDADLRKLRNQGLVSFDEEISNAMYQRYIKVDAEGKRNIGLSIRDLYLKRTDPTEICYMQDSIANLQMLKDRIKVYRNSSGDVFSRIMDNSCIDVIVHKMSELKEWIDALEKANKQELL